MAGPGLEQLKSLFCLPVTDASETIGPLFKGKGTLGERKLMEVCEMVWPWVDTNSNIAMLIQH